MKFIVFIDALDYNEMPPWLKGNCITKYNPGVPKVTPNVISQIMTGNRQEDMKFVRSTPYKKPRASNLDCDTILHYAARKGLKVLQYGIPLCANVELPKGSLSTFDHFLGEQNVPPALQFVQNNMSMFEDDDELIFHSFVDQTSTLFATMRSVARNGQFDVMFIGYQPIDAYTHCYNEENRRRLLLIVEEELKDLNRYGDVLFFSDHGSTKRTKTLYINKWLAERGWLNYEVNYKLINFHEAYPKKFPDTINLEHQHVFIDWDKTKFFCVDAFDAMIDKTEHATSGDCLALCNQLRCTGMFNSVVPKEDVFDKGGLCFDDLPAILPDTKEGVVVSCNIHKSAKEGNKNCMEEVRGGWHSDRAVVGCTEYIETTVTGPRDIYAVMKEFIDRIKPKKQKENELKTVRV